MTLRAAIGGNSSWDGYPAPAHQCFRKAKRRRREWPGRRAGDQRHKEQRRHRQPEAQPKPINVSEYVDGFWLCFWLAMAALFFVALITRAPPGPFTPAPFGFAKALMRRCGVSVP